MVDQLLPEGSAVTPDRTRFLLYADTVRFSTTLGDLCPHCIPWWGLRIAKPAFTGIFSELLLPEEIVSAQVQQATAVVTFRNGFNFDPLRPDSAVFGEIVFRLRNGGPGGPILDQSRIEGETVALPPNTAETVELDFSGTIQSGSIAELSIDSPAGDSVTIDIEDEARVTAALDTLLVSSAVVRVEGKTFLADTLDLETGDVDQGLLDRIQSGALVMEVVNPWNLAALLTVTIDGPTVSGSIEKSITLSPTPQANLRIEFTPEELQQFLGEEEVFATLEASVPVGADPVTVMPGQVLGIKTKVDIVLNIGGGN
jgi:hypothetical protein